MSIKVYEAYRPKKRGDLMTILRDAERRALKIVAKVISDRIRAAAIAIPIDDKELRKAVASMLRDSPPSKPHASLSRWARRHNPELLARCHQAERSVREAYLKQQSDPYRGPDDYDITIHVYEHRGVFGLMLSCGDGVWNARNLLRRDKRLVSFGYWNNSDPPRVPAREWNRRKRFWTAVTDHHPMFSLRCVLMDRHRWYLVTPARFGKWRRFVAKAAKETALTNLVDAAIARLKETKAQRARRK